MKTPEERILAIERSLRCFTLGWCSLLPPFGVILLPIALVTFQQVRIDMIGEWNPAGRYLNWGMILACIGGGISAILVAILVFATLASLQ